MRAISAEPSISRTNDNDDSAGSFPILDVLGGDTMFATGLMPNRSHSSPRRMFLVKSGLVLLGLPMLSACVGRPGESSGPAAPADLTAWLESGIPRLLTSTRVPALSIALVNEGHIAWARGFGVTNSVSGTPVDADTVFEAGSVSKTVFAYVVMKLAEKGTLDLDRPLTRYVSERWVEDDARLGQITARHILSHTGGFQNWRSDKEPIRIQFPPGERWEYSGEGYSYLQLVVSHLTGRVDAAHCETMADGLTVCPTELDDYLRTNLLRPFGMISSGLLLDPALSDTAADGHGEDGRPLNRPRPTPTTAARYGAAGNLLTTAPDYARFLIEVIDPKPQDEFRVSRATRDEMLRPQVKVDDQSSWALGWQILHGPQGDLIAHSGDNPGFKAFALASVDRQSGYVFLMNGDNAREIFAALSSGDTPLNRFVTG
jgi:CubicO group peptidase (beta-lactamase class C family)